MNFEPAMTLTEQIADHLGREIIAGRLKPMARIQELKVAGELGVSRGSVREALLILESRHLVEIIPRRGAVVSAMESKEIANFSELYTELVSLFFCKLTEQSYGNTDVLADALEEMARAVAEADLEAVLTARRDFLLGGLTMLDDFYLGSVLKGLVPAALRVAYLAAVHPAHDQRDTLRYHQALLDAVAGRESERVAELVRAYHRREQKLALGCSANGASLGNSMAADA